VKEIGGRRLLVALLLFHFVLLSRQVSRLEGPPPVVERVMLAATAPLARAVVGVERGLGGIADGWRTRDRLQEENRALGRRELELERELLRLQSLEQDFQRLARAVGYSRSSRRQLSVADVVYVDHVSWLRSLVLHVGEGGARLNQPVVGSSGLVGRVITVAGSFAKVQLVTDRAAGIGAMVERTGRQGVARGDGESHLLLDFVPLQADVRPGDRVVTAGTDGVYPRGLPIGVVRQVTPGRELFHRIEVVPLVDFGRLDHVYLLGGEVVPPTLETEDDVDVP